MAADPQPHRPGTHPELRAEYEQKARDRENFPLTEQQRAIIDAAQDGLNVAVQALAGTGKTSTMVALARRMPNRRITYLAFNSANAADARLKFAGLRHVSVSTAHSLAARDLMVTDLADKVTEGQQDGGTGTNANAEWADILGVQPVPAADRGEDLTAEDIVVLIKETIGNFRNSDSAAIDLIHVPDPEHPWWTRQPGHRHCGARSSNTHGTPGRTRSTLRPGLCISTTTTT
ncbi:hypothetical protein ACFQ60_03940 [Streptomyces zhihengii]